MTVVTLDKFEAMHALMGGGQRHLLQAWGRRSGTRDFTGDLWGMDIEAAGAELAFAKFRNRYWAPSSTPDWDGDVDGWQVRHTQRQNGCLIVRQKDRDEHPFVLVVGAIPTFRVVGWMMGRDAKNPRYWDDVRLTGGGFMVPQAALTPFDTTAEQVAA